MVYLKWDAANWITVVLMVAIAYAAAGTVVAFVKGNLPAAATSGS